MWLAPQGLGGAEHLEIWVWHLPLPYLAGGEEEFFPVGLHLPCLSSGTASSHPGCHQSPSDNPLETGSSLGRA